MSKYENYTQTSNHYDTARTAIGSEIWLGHLTANFDNPAEIHLLDAGCGTGNYTFALANHVGQVSAFDMNEGMLSKAKEKAVLSGLDHKITFHQGQFPNLPFDDDSQDVVMFNQVLHHLEINDKNQFIGMEQVIKEVARILRKGGLLLINACSRAQIQKAYWYYSLIPQAMQQSLRATIGTKDMKNLLSTNGFSNISRTVPLEDPLLGEANFNAQGPLDPKWRAADSIWAFATPDELEDGLKRVNIMKGEGTLSNYLEQHDKPRLQMGQTVFWCAVKS